MKSILASILITFSLMTNGQEMDKVDSIDISAVLSYDNLQDLKQFIINKGQTRTYCNMYNNNPYYEFDEEIRLYLNPITQFPSEDERFNPNTYKSIIVEFPNTQHYNFRYIDVLEDTKERKVYLRPYYDTKQTLIDKNKVIQNIAPNILEEIRR